MQEVIQIKQTDAREEKDSKVHQQNRMGHC